jgi:NADPH:quinone reductase-like Zn-dependent oxidoreductase
MSINTGKNGALKWMKAVRLHKHGAPDVLSYEDVEMPQPGPGQILIKVEAAAVNYADLMRRRNDPYPFPTPLPFTPGSEVAGTVEALGEGVTSPPVGTPVFALVGADGSSGYAQYAVAHAPQVIPIPPGLSLETASGLFVAGTTAALILTEVARVQAGETVLVQAAAGGVGSYAVQLAKHLGATVIAAASTAEKRKHAASLGADHTLDYAQADWPDRVRELTAGRGVDVLLEMTGGPALDQGLSVLAPFGRAVVYGTASSAPAQLSDQTFRHVFYSPALNQSLIAFNVGLWFGLRPERAVNAFQWLIGLVMSNRVNVHIGRVLPLTQAAEAHRLIERRQTTGKVILKPWAEA